MDNKGGEGKSDRENNSVGQHWKWKPPTQSAVAPESAVVAACLLRRPELLPGAFASFFAHLSSESTTTAGQSLPSRASQPCRNNRPTTTLASRSQTKTPLRTQTAASSTFAATAMPKLPSSAVIPSVARSAVTVSCTSSAPIGMLFLDQAARRMSSNSCRSMIQFEAR